MLKDTVQTKSKTRQQLPLQDIPENTISLKPTYDTIPNFTQVPNWILDGRKLFTSMEMDILLFICRKTYGHHEETKWCSLSYIQNGIDSTARGHISATLQTLLHFRLLKRKAIKTRYGKSYEYLIQDNGMKIDGKGLKYRYDTLCEKNKERTKNATIARKNKKIKRLFEKTTSSRNDTSTTKSLQYNILTSSSNDTSSRNDTSTSSRNDTQVNKPVINKPVINTTTGFSHKKPKEGIPKLKEKVKTKLKDPHKILNDFQLDFYLKFIQAFNEKNGTKYRGDKDSKTNFKSICDYLYLHEDMEKAIENLAKSEFHIPFNNPEFISRPRNFEKWVNMKDAQIIASNERSRRERGIKNIQVSNEIKASDRDERFKEFLGAATDPPDTS